MIFLVFGVLCILALIIAAFGFYGRKLKGFSDNNFKDFCYCNDECLLKIGLYSLVIIIAFVLVFSVAPIGNYLEAPALEAQMNETYNALCFKIENDFIRDEFGLLNKELVDEIQAWNEDVSYNKTRRENMWFKIFVSPVYDKFETIDLSELEK